MKSKKIAIYLLCICFLLTSCSPRNVDTEGALPAVSGQYMERKTEFPPFTELIAFTEVADDSYFALGLIDGRNEIWSSTNGGANWSQLDYAGIEELQILKGTFNSQGDILLYCEQTFDTEDQQLYCVNATSSGWQELDVITPMEMTSYGLYLTDTGYLLSNQWDHLVQINMQNGRELYQYSVDSDIWYGSYVEYDGTLALSGKSHIALYDMDAGEKISEITYPNVESNRVIAVQPDRSGFFYCDHSGLYRISMDGAIAEQLIDGQSASFGIYATGIYGLHANKDGSFLLLCRSNGIYEAKRFEFQQQTATSTEAVLHVYSLYENQYIQQTIALYMLENPGVAIQYHVGVADDSAVTVDDALRTFTADLLAGSGPDIIVLDGMPVESYIRQDALLTLDDTVSGGIDDYYPSLMQLYQRQDGLYAVPSRFHTHLLAGVGIDNIQTIQDLEHYLTSQEVSISALSPNAILRTLLPFQIGQWLTEEGTLNIAGMREDLSSMKVIADFSEAALENGILPGLMNHAAIWSNDGMAFMNGTLDSFFELAVVYSAMETRGEGSIKLFPENSCGTVYAGSVLGINSQTVYPEAAKEFVQFAIDTPAQSGLAYQSGFPVNREALMLLAEASGYGENLGRVGATEELSLDVYWPREEQFQQIFDLFEQANSVPAYNEIIYQIILIEAQPLFTDSASTIDDVVKNVEQKVERYLQEQG